MSKQSEHLEDWESPQSLIMYSVGAIMWKWHSHTSAGKSMKWHNAYGQDLATSSKMTNIAFDPTFLLLDIYATDTLIEKKKKMSVQGSLLQHYLQK